MKRIAQTKLGQRRKSSRSRIFNQARIARDSFIIVTSYCQQFCLLLPLKHFAIDFIDFGLLTQALERSIFAKKLRRYTDFVK